MGLKKIIILVPGIMGSQLFDRQKNLIWPGNLWRYIRGYSDEQFRQIMQPDLFADGVIESYYFDQYIDIINPLKKWGFAEMSEPKQLPTEHPDHEPRGLYIFSYDWRKDNRLAAAKLADVVDAMHNAKSPEDTLEITLLCHSMGGLLSRYYLESDALSGRQGLQKVDRIVFMGTPHHGAPKAIFYIRGEEKMLWLKKEQVKLLADYPEYLSVYQLLPTPALACLFEQLQQGIATRDLHTDHNLAARIGLNASKIADAQRFHQELNPGKLFNGPNSPKTFSFYASHHETKTTLLYNGQSNTVELYETAPDGDGTVPALSACLRNVPCMAVEAEHSKIYASSTMLNFLPKVLGVPIQVAVGAEAIQVTISDPFLSEGDEISGVLILDQDIALSVPSWKLELEIFQVQENQEEQAVNCKKTISVSGLNARKLPFIMNVSMLAPGKYSLHYHSDWPTDEISPDNYITEGKVDFVVLGDE